LPKNTTQCPRPGLEPGPLDPETSALTMRPPRLRAHPHTLENFVTHRSEKFWLSRDCPYLRTYVRLYANTLKTERVAPLPLLWFWVSTLLLIDSFTTSYRLTSITWAYRGLRFRAHRGWVFFWSWPLTSCWFTDWIADSSHIISLGGGRSTCKGKISAQINPWRILDFSSDIFFVQSSLEKFHVYFVRNFYSLG